MSWSENPETHSRILMNTLPVIHVVAPHTAHHTKSLDSWQFEEVRIKAVGRAKREGGRDCIAYEDSLRVAKHHAPKARMEEWAEPANLSLVLVTLWERRAWAWKTRSQQLEHQGISLRERLQQAQAALEARRPAMLAHLDELCKRYVACSGSEERKKLVAQIRSLDGELKVIARGPGLIARIVYLSLRMGLDSVAVGQEIGFGPTFCRQQLHRCRLAWARLDPVRSAR